MIPVATAVFEEISPHDLDFDKTIRVKKYAPGQKMFQRYVLEKRLGQGGMGEVWLACDERLGKQVALKFLAGVLVDDKSALDELRQETARGQELTHPNIIRIYDFQQDENEGEAAISMEYVDGGTLSNRRARQPQGIFEPNDVRKWLSEICDALHYAHTYARVVHRDIKPRNIMLTSAGEIKVSDFGISKSISDSMTMLTCSVQSSGAPPYMSPQQWDGKRSTPLDDVYSFGATVYELLTGKPPFLGIVDRQRVHHEIVPSVAQRRSELGIDYAAPLPSDWEDTIAACLSKDPQLRPQTMQEVAILLNLKESSADLKSSPAENVESASSSPPPASPLPVLKASKKTNYWLLGATAGGVLLFLAGGAAFMRLRNHASEVGTVYITSHPQGAQISLDGGAASKSPVTFPDVKRGDHHLHATLDGYESVDEDIAFHEAALQHSIELKPLVQPLASSPAPAASSEQTLSVSPDDIYRRALAAYIDVLRNNPDSVEARSKLAKMVGSIVTDEDFARCSDLLATAAHLDFEPAIMVLGERLAKTNPQDSFNWFYYAAMKGNVLAMLKVALAYGKGVNGEGPDPVAGFVWLQKFGLAHQPTDHAFIGDYRFHPGGDEDERDAIELIHSAATKAGIPQALTLLGQAYSYPWGQCGNLKETERLAKAKLLFEEAKSKGDWSACYHLGLFYETGTGVQRDVKTAAEIYRSGAEHNDVLSTFRYAECLVNHRAELNMKDDVTAWYLKAATAGYSKAVDRVKEGAKKGVKAAQTWCDQRGIDYRE